MIVPLIVAVLIALVLVVIFFKVFRSIIKAIVLVVLLILIVGVVFGFFIVRDARDFQETFTSKPTTYLLEDEGNLLTGFEALALNFSTITPLDKDILQQRKKSSPAITMIIDKSILTTSTTTYSLFEELNLTLETALVHDSDVIRANAFMIALFQTLSEQGPLFLIRQTREGTVTIRPNSFIIRLIAWSNKDLLDSLKSDADVAFSEVKDRINDSLTKKEGELA